MSGRAMRPNKVSSETGARRPPCPQNENTFLTVSQSNKWKCFPGKSCALLGYTRNLSLSMAIFGFMSPFWGDGGIPPPAGGGLLCPWRQSNQNATRETLRMGAARPYSRPPGPRSTRDSPESDQNPSGAQNQECLGAVQSGPTGALGIKRLSLARFSDCA